jgi:hypothetical protein
VRVGPSAQRAGQLRPRTRLRPRRAQAGAGWAGSYQQCASCYWVSEVFFWFLFESFAGDGPPHSLPPSASGAWPNKHRTPGAWQKAPLPRRTAPGVRGYQPARRRVPAAAGAIGGGGGITARWRRLQCLRRRVTFEVWRRILVFRHYGLFPRIDRSLVGLQWYVAHSSAHRLP